MWIATSIQESLFRDRPDVAAQKLVNLDHYRTVTVEGRDRRDDGRFRYWVVAAHPVPTPAGSVPEPLAAVPDEVEAHRLLQALQRGLNQGADIVDLAQV